MYDEAILDFGYALQIKPNDINAFLNRALAFLYIKNYPSTLDDYNSIIRLEPGNADALTNRGAAYQYLDQKEKACEDWKNASDLGSVKAKTYLEKYCAQ